MPLQVEIVGLKETVKTTVTGVEMFKKSMDHGQVTNDGASFKATRVGAVFRSLSTHHSHAHKHTHLRT